MKEERRGEDRTGDDRTGDDRAGEESRRGEGMRVVEDCRNYHSVISSTSADIDDTIIHILGTSTYLCSYCIYQINSIDSHWL